MYRARCGGASLVRLGRTVRFRQVVKTIATALNLDADQFSLQLVAALATLAQTMGKDLAERDWWRLIDALVLIAAHPAGRSTAISAVSIYLSHRHLR